MTPDLTTPRVPVLPPVEVTWPSWRAAVVRELRWMSADLWDTSEGNEKTAEWLDVRADRLEGCAVWGTAMGCDRCGSPVPGSYSPAALRASHCDTRSCPWCARRRAARSAGLAARIAEQPWAPHVGWWLATITVPREIDDPAAATVSALRARLAAVRRGMTGVVEALRRDHGMVAAWGGIELSTGAAGHVHAHMLLAVENPDLDLTDKDARGAGREWWLAIRAALGLGPIGDCRRAGPESVQECIKYAVKSPDPATWQHSSRVVVSPILAARWELAGRGVRLRERWGAARGLAWHDPDDELSDGPETVEDMIECRCPHCGIGDHVSAVTGRTAQLLAWFRLSGADPLRGPPSPRVDPWTAMQYDRWRVVRRARERAREE